MKTIIILFLFLMTNLYAQIDVKPIEEFIGTWEGIYEAGGIKNKEILVNEFLHKKMFFRMEVSGEMLNNPDYKYTSSALFTINDDDEIIGWGFNEDGFNGIINYKGKIDNNKINLTGKSSEYKVEISYEIKDSKLVRKSKWIYNDKPDKPSVIECVYKKK
jgi:hypothetical protein